MKNILIAGITGAVGEGIAAYFLTNNFKVTAVVRSEAKKSQVLSALSELNYKPDQLRFIVNSFSSDAETAQLTEQLMQEEKIAIASLGGWHRGTDLAELSENTWNEYLKQSLTSHFYFSKACLQYFKKINGGAYVMINGGASEFSVPHSGVISIMAAAQKMQTQVLHQENKKHNIDVFAVAAFQVVSTRKNAFSDELWLTTNVLGKYIEEAVYDKKFAAKGYWHKIQSLSDLE
jgi:NAD(P)-dependent dehydrogenase (short-subunit alcohol dehydrogenase family)